MVQVKNISTRDVIIVTDSRVNSKMKVQHLIKPGQVMNLLLCPAMKRLVEEGYISLVDGGEILDIPGGMMHKKPSPLPPLRSVDEDWLA